ncbi:hypothetical protein NDU88_003189 [Pleurodeles waltl]|uniref:Uncharacterized protein n=1 Tax=Pleurodeles waltl TaxID=8319 RepID=A0AAV7LHT7_PLEWA|nr:hypothetical protein NDU88_003189 [Pleurodeles waltl]
MRTAAGVVLGARRGAGEPVSTARGRIPTMAEKEDAGGLVLAPETESRGTWVRTGANRPDRRDILVRRSRLPWDLLRGSGSAAGRAGRSAARI